jgi:uncharacterized protein (DUF3820 family)
MRIAKDDYVRFRFRTFEVIGLVEETGADGLFLWPQTYAPSLPVVVRKPVYIPNNRILYKEVKLRFGKYAGQWLGDCPDDYLRWLAKQASFQGERILPRMARAILRARGVQPLPTWRPVSRRWFEEQQALMLDTSPYARPGYAKQDLWDARDDQDIVYVQDGQSITCYRIESGMNQVLLFKEVS